jgi:hypothetical protein
MRVGCTAYLSIAAEARVLPPPLLLLLLLTLELLQPLLLVAPNTNVHQLLDFHLFCLIGAVAAYKGVLEEGLSL